MDEAGHRQKYWLVEFPQGQGQQRMGEEIFYLDKEGKRGSRGLEALGTIRHNRWNRINK